jgi:hypothetical protein
MSRIADTRDVNDPSGGHVYLALDLPRHLRPNIETALKDRKAGMRDLCDCVCQSLSTTEAVSGSGLSFRRGEHAAWLDTVPIRKVPIRSTEKVPNAKARGGYVVKSVITWKTVGGGPNRSSWDELAARDEREWSTVIPPDTGGALCRCYIGVPVGAPNGGACGKYSDFLARKEPGVPCDPQGHCGGVQVKCTGQSYCKDDGQCSPAFPRGDSGALRAFDSTDNLGYRPRECGGDLGGCPVDTPYCLDDGTCWKDMRKGDTGINRTMDDIFSRRMI